MRFSLFCYSFFFLFINFSGLDGSIRVLYNENDQVRRIERLTSEGKVAYSHEYHYDSEGKIESETLPFNLGKVLYAECKTKSPFHTESWEINENGFVISHRINRDTRKYTYTEDGALEIFPTEVDYGYDDHGNVSFIGKTQFFYDKNHRLKKATTPEHKVRFKYNRKGYRTRRIIDGKMERYRTRDGNDFAILENGKLKEIRIPGLSSSPHIVKSIAFETIKGIYIPIHDRMGNVILLVNGKTREMIRLQRSDPFGKGMSKDAPISWPFMGKYYDKELDLIYFGSRYYSPKIHKWLTPDPARQSDDLYHYCFNNPLSYFDPDGEFAVSVPIVTVVWGGGVVVSIPVLTAAGIGTAIGYGLFRGYKYLEKKKKERLAHGDSPPFTWEDLGDDSEKCPGKGFKWKGRGKPKSGKGSWVRDEKGKKGELEILHPDFDHYQHDPHWDYESSKFPAGTRIYPEGWEHKVP